jgi:hypothetical protein
VALPAEPTVLLVRFTWLPEATALTTLLALTAVARRPAMVLPVSPSSQKYQKTFRLSPVFKKIN